MLYITLFLSVQTLKYSYFSVLLSDGKMVVLLNFFCMLSSSYRAWLFDTVCEKMFQSQISKVHFITFWPPTMNYHCSCPEGWMSLLQQSSTYIASLLCQALKHGTQYVCFLLCRIGSEELSAFVVSVWVCTDQCFICVCVFLFLLAFL